MRILGRDVPSKTQMRNGTPFLIYGIQLIIFTHFHHHLYGTYIVSKLEQTSCIMVTRGT